MINAAHVVIYTRDAEADRAFFRDVLRLNWVDAGHGWLIFALPPAELGIHPADEKSHPGIDAPKGHHQLYLMCDDLNSEIATLEGKGVKCAGIVEARWGSITKIRLPGGGEIGLYQPKHPRPE